MTAIPEQLRTVEITALRLIRAFVVGGDVRHAVAPIPLLVPEGSDTIAADFLIDYLAGVASVFLIDRHHALQDDAEQALPDEERQQLARRQAEDWINSRILDNLETGLPADDAG